VPERVHPRHLRQGVAVNSRRQWRIAVAGFAAFVVVFCTAWAGIHVAGLS
jgi:hypothetical protein